MVPVGVKPSGELQHVILRAKDFGGFGFHSVVIGTSGSGKSEYFLSLCNGIALTHSPESFIVIFVDMKFESAAQDLAGLPHVAGSLSNLGKDDRHLAERMRKAVNGEIARRYRLFKRAGARDANEYEEMRLAGRELEPVPILLVIIDEYLELFHHHPEWIDLVIHIGQEGRGCNVFFTLGGQRLDLSSLSKAKSNIAFRVALRAETAEDSRDVIGSDAALHLRPYTWPYPEISTAAMVSPSGPRLAGQLGQIGRHFQRRAFLGLRLVIDAVRLHRLIDGIATGNHGNRQRGQQQVSRRRHSPATGLVQFH